MLAMDEEKVLGVDDRPRNIKTSAAETKLTDRRHTHHPS